VPYYAAEVSYWIEKAGKKENLFLSLNRQRGRRGVKWNQERKERKGEVVT